LRKVIGTAGLREIEQCGGKRSLTNGTLEISRSSNNKKTAKLCGGDSLSFKKSFLTQLLLLLGICFLRELDEGIMSG
jgi:hypothetical protein